MITPVWLLPDELWVALGLTLQLAAVSTVILMLIVLPLGWWLATTRHRAALLLEILMSLPLVLPPTVIGFYLLTLLSPQHALGQWWQQLFGQTLPFSFAGLVIGSCVYSLPFALQPVMAAFRMLRPEIAQAAYSLGMTRWQAFLHVLLPLSKAGVYSGAILAFAHTIGEFGVVLMLGGGIPGVTRVASIALYDEAQKLNYPDAHGFALLLLALSFILLCATTALQKRQERWRQLGHFSLR
ncbi:molybdate ABC transporter permease subunit [Actimicrobium sp. CCC2.4]|uniref:molybdate ABC transporter permease subunit n=1 Tax=Actimicrobium sp. CCC2.4 TaxID=3048606 RepID=UPI002AC89C42|nr:molybdate ABC transporter permease subunit [Actimicrobium sp. CCC2.4]MEB0133938.1 molybdate ABC transporter permease subunit [Actimicrobium sp. CCC2.4]WPX31478.1 molybdate ABC transporter permease subunit [Actimicrobium sp. CCC2.4]